MKKVLTILLIIMLIITFIQIRNMYALYKDELSGEYETSLGKWNVKVNGTDIVEPGMVVEFEMLDGNIRYLDNAFKSTGAAITPNTEAFFDILFDTSDTDVAVKYIIEFGEINSYNIINRETGKYVVDTTDDKVEEPEDNGEEIVDPVDDEIENTIPNNVDDEEMNPIFWEEEEETEEVFDNSPDDYEFALKYPLKFEMQEGQMFFGEYNISAEEGTAGLIVGEESETEYEKNIVVDTDTKTIVGVIPLAVNKALIEGQDGESAKTGLQCKTSIKFKWIIDEDTISEENKKEYEDMYQYLTSRNNETEYVKLKMPIKVKAIQYLGEDL